MARTAKSRYELASGSPFQEKDAEIIGRALRKIAEQHRVGDIRQLNAKDVLSAVLADVNHPLRPYYEWNEKKAAKAHWLQQTRKLICSIRVVEVDIKPVMPRPMFYTADNLPKMEDNGSISSRGRGRILRDDIDKDASIEMRIAEGYVKRLRSVYRELARFVADQKLPMRYTVVASEIDSAISKFDASGRMK